MISNYMYMIPNFLLPLALLIHNYEQHQFPMSSNLNCWLQNRHKRYITHFSFLLNFGSSSTNRATYGKNKIVVLKYYCDSPKIDNEFL